MEPRVMSEQTENTSLKRFIGLGITLFLIVTIIGGAVFLFRETHPPIEADHPESPRVQRALEDPKTAPYYRDLIPVEASSQENPGYTTPPEFQIGRYTITTQLPRIPGATNLYTLKTEFPPEEVTGLAKKVIGDSAELLGTDNEYHTFSSNFGFMTFNTKTGAFTAQSTTLRVPFTLPEDAQDARPQLTAFLRDNLGIIDNTVEITAHYNKASQPGITSYEFHRVPEKTGLIITSPIGAANLREDELIADGSLTSFGADDPSNPDIIQASDAPGKARRTDFNTLTVDLSNDGAIVAIESNIRPIEKAEPLGSLKLALLSPEQALEELQQKGTYFNVSLPSGQGHIAYDKVYIDNQLRAQEAIITDIALTFTEKPPAIAQRFLQPVYIVRGYAETDTGVRVKFAQTIPAIENLEPVVYNNPLDAFVAWVKDTFVQTVLAQDIIEIRVPCDGDGSQEFQECTFEKFKNTPIPEEPTPEETTPVPNTPVPNSPNPTPPPSDKCILLNLDGEAIEEGKPIYIPGVGTVYYFANLPNGPLVQENTSSSNPYGISLNRGQYSGSSYTVSSIFQRKIEDELKSIGAQIALDNPSRVEYRQGAYGNRQEVDLQTLYGTSFDIQGRGGGTTSGSYLSSSAYVIYYQAVQGSLKFALDRSDNSQLQELASLPTPLQDAGVPIDTIWMSRRKANQFGLTGSRVYNGFELDERCRYITTVSPLLYFYPQQETDVSLRFDHKNIAYADPYKADTYKFTAQPNGGLMFDTITRDRIHYEYANITLPRPDNGWNIPHNNIEEFIQNLGNQLNLTQEEIADLINDVQRSMINTNLDDSIFIGLIDQNTIEENLPFTIQPQPNHTHRVHLYIGSAGKTNAPDIQPIDRSGFTVIELGAYVE